MLYESHILSQDYFYSLHGTNLAWILEGYSIERAEEIWGLVIENQIIPHLRPEIISGIEVHRSQARRVILISGSFAPLLDELTLRLELEGAIASSLAVKNGHYTGKILPLLNIGWRKIARKNNFWEARGKGST